MKKKISYIGCFLINIYLSGKTTLAQYTLDENFRPANSPTNPWDYSAKGVSYIIGEFITLLLQFSGGVAIFFIVFSGFKYVTSIGKQEKIDEAKRSLTWAIIGLVAIILSYAIVQNILQIIFDVPEEATNS